MNTTEEETSQEEKGDDGYKNNTPWDNVECTNDDILLKSLEERDAPPNDEELKDTLHGEKGDDTEIIEDKNVVQKTEPIQEDY